MGQRSIRFPDGLEARVQARADELDRSFSWVVLKALESALVSAGDSASGERMPSTDRQGPGSSRASSEPVGEVLGAKVRRVPSIRDTWGR